MSGLVRYRFRDAVLDPGAGELVVAGRPIPIEPKAFALLLHLVRHRGRVVSRSELLSAVWPDVVVSQGVVARTVMVARRALGESGPEGSVIRTQPKYGYRFDVPVLEEAVESPAPKGETPEAHSGPELVRTSQPTERLLTIGALLGEHLDPGTLVHALGWPRERVAASLDEAIERGILVSTGATGRYAFRDPGHAKMRTDALTIAQQSTLHAAIAEALSARRDASQLPLTYTIAQHTLRAGSDVDPVLALDRVKAAVNGAMANRDYSRALELLEGALEVLSARTEIAHDALPALLLSKAHALHGAGAPHATVKATFRRAAEMAEQVPDQELVAEIALGYAGDAPFSDPFFRGEDDDPDRVRWLRRALEQVEPHRYALRARLLSLLAGTAIWSAELDRREAMSADSLELAAASGDVEARLTCLLGRAMVLAENPDRFVERDAITRELLDETAQRYLPVREIDARIARATFLLERGDASEADALVEPIAALAAQAGKPFERARLHLWRAMRAALAGEFVLAETHLSRCRSAAGGVFEGVERACRWFELHMAVRQRDHDKVEGLIGDLGSSEDPSGALDVLRASLELARGEEAQARRVLRRLVVHGCRAVPLGWNRLPILAELATIAMALSDRDAAGALYDALAPYSARVMMAGYNLYCHGSVALPLGELAAMLGHFEMACMHFDFAIALHDQLGAWPRKSETLVAYGRALIQAGRIAEGRTRIAEGERLARAFTEGDGSQ